MQHTPLYDEHLKLKAKMVEFGGWEMPLSYPTGILAEHLATRRSGGLFDISHMGRFRVSGDNALPFLQHVLASNVAAIEPGQSQYAIIPNENGGAVDDAYLYRLTEGDYLLVVNAANTEKDWAWLQKCASLFPKLILEDRTDRISMLALQGPHAKSVLTAVISGPVFLEPLRNNLAIVEILNTRMPVSRTGYTGEPIGFELFPPSEMVAALWHHLLKVGKGAGIVPVGLGARDTLRLEAGLPLYGHELGVDAEGKEIPIFALPMARFAVSFAAGKGEFIGREALFRQFEEVRLRLEGLPDKAQYVPRVIMPVVIPNGSVARAGCAVLVNDKPVGYVTSGTVVPYWKTEGLGAYSKPGNESARRAIALAYLDADLKVGQRTRIIIRDKIVAGVIVERHLASEAAPYARPIIAGEPITKESIN
jgi:aminomethyltransferase